MIITDSYEKRLEMAKMHDDIILRIDNAIKKKQAIEACWLCYACFESRITRTIDKLSVCCKERKCYNNHKVGIVTKIDCLKRLSRQNYGGANQFENALLGEVKVWCKERNILVHDLVSLNNYRGIDKKFLDLAKKGRTILEKLYKQTTNFRNIYYQLDELPEIPTKVIDKCRLIKKD